MKPTEEGLSVAIDIGGTFTDIVVVDGATARIHTYKELTTPADPSVGVIAGVRNLFERDGIAYRDVSRVIHATTLFTNALITRKGATTALITTEGFRDVLEIGHERKYELYDVFLRMPRPLVPRRLRFGVDERVLSNGTVERVLDEAQMAAIVERLEAQQVRSVAVVFLHSYANADNEIRARDILERLAPDLFVSISSEISPQIREYERTSTTVANAYVKPLAHSYLDKLSASLRSLGVKSDLFLMLSNGGLTHIDEAKRKPVEMLESGPAAGALSAAHFGAKSNFKDLLAFDMGGTTAKLAVVDNGEPLIAHQFEAARDKRFMPGSGIPVTISTIELVEIGAGGGSIAHLDQLGLLAVGPQSAGSAPGPACYARGGVEATVTDANLILGYLDPKFFAGGTMALDRKAAEDAVARLSREIDLDTVATAWSIHNNVNESMASAARVHIAERGMDPRRYALLATGGGGPLHACEVARKLNISRVICPPSAGVASAIGMIVAPARVDRARSFVRRLDQVDWTALEQIFAQMEREARKVVEDVGFDPGAAIMTRMADMRYSGQGFDIVVKLPAGPYSAQAREAFVAAFEAAYREIFSRTLTAGLVQVVNLRVSLQTGDEPVAIDLETRKSGDALKGTRDIYEPRSGQFVNAPVYDRRLLGPNSSLDGPALVEEPESTLIIPAAGRARFETSGNIVIVLDAQGTDAAPERAARGVRRPEMA